MLANAGIQEVFLLISGPWNDEGSLIQTAERPASCPVEIEKGLDSE